MVLQISLNFTVFVTAFNPWHHSTFATCSKWQKKITRTGQTLKQHGKLKPERWRFMSYPVLLIQKSILHQIWRVIIYLRRFKARHVAKENLKKLHATSEKKQNIFRVLIQMFLLHANSRELVLPTSTKTWNNLFVSNQVRFLLFSLRTLKLNGCGWFRKGVLLLSLHCATIYMSTQIFNAWFLGRFILILYVEQ